MCYSAQLHETYALHVRKWGAEIAFPSFVRFYGQRHEAKRRTSVRWHEDRHCHRDRVRFAPLTPAAAA